MVLGALEAAWLIPAALAVCGLVFLGDAAAESGPRHHNVGTFVLNVLSLPIGGATLFLGALDAYAAGAFGLASASAVVVGAILAGRSLREIPWTGAASLIAAAGAGGFLVTHSPWALTLPQILAAAGVVFLLVFLALYFLELPLRLAGLLALPRPLLVGLGVGALAVAGYLAVALGA